MNGNWHRGMLYMASYAKEKKTEFDTNHFFTLIILCNSHFFTVFAFVNSLWTEINDIPIVFAYCIQSLWIWNFWLFSDLSQFVLSDLTIFLTFQLWHFNIFPSNTSIAGGAPIGALAKASHRDSQVSCVVFGVLKKPNENAFVSNFRTNKDLFNILHCFVCITIYFHFSYFFINRLMVVLRFISFLCWAEQHVYKKHLILCFPQY